MLTVTELHRTASLLNRLLRGEMSAVDAFDICLDHAAPSHLPVLRTCRDAHAERSRMLSKHIRTLGELPNEGPGVWCAITATISSSAAMMTEDRIIDLLLEGEDHGKNEYKVILCDEGLDEETKVWVRDTLFTNQLFTHRLINELEPADR